MINNTTAAIRKLKLKILSVASHRHVVSFLKVGVGWGQIDSSPQKKESLQIMKILIRRGWGDRQKQKIYYNFDFTINFLFFIHYFIHAPKKCVWGGLHGNLFFYM